MASSDQTGPKPISAPDDMHWGINYLREDIQDIRAEARESRADAKADHAALRVEIGSLREALLRRLDSRFYLTMGMMVTMIGVLAALMKL
jgi:hypothetical protein